MAIGLGLGERIIEIAFLQRDLHLRSVNPSIKLNEMIRPLCS